jgi:hypothetical protein
MRIHHHDLWPARMCTLVKVAIPLLGMYDNSVFRTNVDNHDAIASPEQDDVQAGYEEVLQTRYFWSVQLTVRATSPKHHHRVVPDVLGNTRRSGLLQYFTSIRNSNSFELW